MYNIEVLEVDVPTELEPEEEIRAILDEYVLGASLKERSLYRLYRMWRSKSHLLIRDRSGDGSSMYETWEQFLQDTVYALGVSRSTVFFRIRAYSFLDWLGYSDDEKLQMIAARPTLYPRVMSMLVDWDTAKCEPNEIYVDVAEGEGDSVENVRDIIENIASGELSVGEALEQVQVEYTGRPSVRLRCSGESLVVVYEYCQTDEAGGQNFVSGELEYMPVVLVPEIVNEELRRRLGVANN